MKKTLVALAVAAMAATSANAATVYQQDGTKIDIGGRFDVMVGKFGDDQRGDLRNNESRIEFHAEQDIANGWKALAHLRFRFNDEKGDRNDTSTSFNNPTTNKLWAGIKHDEIGRLTFGKQDTNNDAVQMNDHSYFSGDNNNLNTGGDKVLSFRSADYAIAAGQTLAFGVDYEFGDSKKKPDANATAEERLKYAYGATLFYAGQFGDFGAKVNLGADIQKFDNTLTTATASEIKSWRAATQFTYGPATFGAEYGQSTFKDAGVNNEKGRYLEVGAKYQYLENASVYTSWLRDQVKEISSGYKETTNKYGIGADYGFTKNVVTYIEYQHARTKDNSANSETVKDNKYGVGLRVYF